MEHAVLRFLDWQFIFAMEGLSMRLFTLCSFVTVLFLSTLPSYSADPQHGLVLAKRWCATCHVVSADQQRASADVPPFATIARSPNFNPRELA
jgi:hypothetical protein